MGKIYVGNVAGDATESDLRDLFGRSGKVVSVSLEAQQNYAYVEMETAEETAAAVRDTNGKPLRGRALKVNELKIKTTVPRPAPAGRSGGSRGRSRARSRGRR
jgi:RNA recognition motif-containing protein